MGKVFSIKEKYSHKIFSKEKLVEFRRQNVNVNEGELCLIYTSSPTKKITGYFIVKAKIRASIQDLWKLTKNIAGISHNEFLNYFKDCKMGTAILLKNIQKFSDTFELEYLRREVNFRPPQSYCNLNSVLFDIFKNVIPRNLIITIA